MSLDSTDDGAARTGALGWSDDALGRDARAHGRSVCARSGPRLAAMEPSTETTTPEDAQRLDDHELVRRAQTGDEDAFGELVRRHEGRAVRVARQLVPDAEDARDLAQEAFLRVFRSLDRFDFKHEFTTWLYRIVTNLGIDHLRRRRPVATGAAGEDDGPVREDEDESAPQPFERLERNETAALVRACIDVLPEHFRAVLALRELEGLTSQEISRIVGATPVTVRWRLHRARKLFAEQWQLLEERREREREAAAGGLLEWARADRRDDHEPQR